MAIYIGISGWQYEPWNKTFYPPQLRPQGQLAYASREFNSIEVNSSFYRFHSPHVYRRWYEETPADFRFTLKAHRTLTHLQRLRHPQENLANFLASGPLELKEKWAGILWQLPPHFHLSENNWDLLEDFFDSLPQDQIEAAQWTHASSRFEPQSAHGPYRLYHSLEVRSHSFLVPDFIKLLKKYNIALVFADTAGKWPYCEDITSDHIYLRLHGDESFYRTQYEDSQINFFARRLQAWVQGRYPPHSQNLLNEEFSPPQDIFVYFDNDLKIHAPQNALKLQESMSPYLTPRP